MKAEKKNVFSVGYWNTKDEVDVCNSGIEVVGYKETKTLLEIIKTVLYDTLYLAPHEKFTIRDVGEAIERLAEEKGLFA